MDNAHTVLAIRLFVDFSFDYFSTCAGVCTFAFVQHHQQHCKRNIHHLTAHNVLLFTRWSCNRDEKKNIFLHRKYNHQLQIVSFIVVVSYSNKKTSKIKTYNWISKLNYNIRWDKTIKQYFVIFLDMWTMWTFFFSLKCIFQLTFDKWCNTLLCFIFFIVSDDINWQCSENFVKNFYFQHI